MNLKWHNASNFRVEGKGWTGTANFYDRLPARAEKLVRPAVWNLSQNSAGIAINFVSNADSISVRWKLRSTMLSLTNMAAIGVSGVDLYVKEKQHWRWVGVGKPDKPVLNEQKIIGNMRRLSREFRLYLPLYNGIDSLEIGVPEGTLISSAPALAQPVKPIVFYGTSIVQGASASRPGMAYPAILGRTVGRPTINLGFSGNGLMEEEIAELLAEVDADIYVLDCLPNLSDKTKVETKTPRFIEILRRKQPYTPIILAENIQYPDVFIDQNKNKVYQEKNAALRRVFDALLASGTKNLYYIASENLIGVDGEGTIDGIHPNDLGFSRMASAFQPLIMRILKPGSSTP